jgi:hypothetical protein
VRRSCSESRTANFTCLTPDGTHDAGEIAARSQTALDRHCVGARRARADASPCPETRRVLSDVTGADLEDPWGAGTVSPALTWAFNSRQRAYSLMRPPRTGGASSEARRGRGSAGPDAVAGQGRGRAAGRVAVPAAGSRPGGGAARAGPVLLRLGGLRRAVAAGPAMAVTGHRGDPGRPAGPHPP